MNKVFDQLQDFIEFAAKELGLEEIPTIYFAGKKENKYNAFGHAKGDEVHVRVTDRHPGDIMRTIAHELVHYLRNTQNESVAHEDDANALAGRLMRKYNIKNPKIFKMKPVEADAIKEDGVAANCIGSGGIAMVDPVMKAGVMKRVAPKRLSDIIGSKAEKKEKRKDR